MEDAVYPETQLQRPRGLGEIAKRRRNLLSAKEPKTLSGLSGEE